eukprot:12498638-Alexandrium_andersonii.AAC.1
MGGGRGVRGWPARRLGLQRRCAREPKSPLLLGGGGGVHADMEHGLACASARLGTSLRIVRAIVLQTCFAYHW